MWPAPGKTTRVARGSRAATRNEKLWSLEPVVRPDVPAGVSSSSNPIDAFVGALHREKGLRPAAAADRRTLLRRIHLDLTGLPPTPSEQEAFLRDPAPDAYERLVDKLLQSEAHGVRYARRWLDVLRYADVDDRMPAASGIHLWRDWVVAALNEDMPYDQFARAQLTVDAGSLYIPANQRLARLAFYLIEPESDDGLVTWNIIEEGLAVGQTYPIYRVVDSRAITVKTQ